MTNRIKGILKVLDCFGMKRIAVNFFEGRLIAVELGKGVYIDETIEQIYSKIPKSKKYNEVREGLLSKNYWNNSIVLEYLAEYWKKKANIRIVNYYLFVLFPEEKRNIMEDWLKKTLARTKILRFCVTCFSIISEDCILNNLDIPQLDTDKEYRKLLFLYSSKEDTYIGLAYAGFVVDSIYIEGGYEELTVKDILSNIEKILTNIPEEMPISFKRNNKDKKIRKLIKDWKKPYQQVLYISAPEEFKNKFDNIIEGYKIEYLGYDEMSIIKGMEKVMALYKKWFRFSDFCKPVE